MSVKLKGTVTWFDTTKGFGFLLVDDGNGDVLLHACCRKTVKELLRGLLAALGGQGEAVWQRQLSIAGSHQTFDEHSLRMQ